MPLGVHVLRGPGASRTRSRRAGQSYLCPKKSLLPSFRGREHSDRRYAPSEDRLRERSPESISTGLQLQWHVAFHAPPWVMDSGLAGRSAKADLPTPRNDAEGWITLTLICRANPPGLAACWDWVPFDRKVSPGAGRGTFGSRCDAADPAKKHNLWEPKNRPGIVMAAGRPFPPPRARPASRAQLM
jgi:hypothetical protein